ncbi:MAG: HlyC/CorC family transporter [Candidatus Marinimicrobia bacterium]|nr:HlyC/CorC family transporter [Candidatus Neomarinimicrobiota bacterium]MBL7022713.1 HlyC/CorC family transporter [Candidatus Neomarinimicrobiota bacterium]MBL7109158.1 HlyC/CorC family transporter [Candidatus Neomarinimicrobiota bacterium]
MLPLNLALLGLILSILFTAAEIALISANKLQMKVWIKQKKRSARLAFSTLLNKEEYLITILIGTNISNIIATSFGTVFLLEWNLHPIVIISIISLIILLVGEILPKSIVREFSNISLLILSPGLYFFGIIFYPINFLLKKAGWMKIAETPTKTTVSQEQERDDLQNLYEQADVLPEAMEEDQRELISNVFEFSESTVSDAMTPRTEISAVSNNDSLKDILHKIIDSGHSKIPVYNGDIDNITGIIYLYDLFKSPKNIKDIIHPVPYIPYTKSAKDTLMKFQTAHHALAIVLDEHGGTAGLVTAEDLFEELFGEFEDEFDSDESDDYKTEVLDDGSIIANAKIECDAFNDLHGNIIPDGDYETLAGYLINELGRIPNKGEHLFLNIGQVIIKKASARRIEQVQLYLKDEL